MLEFPKLNNLECPDISDQKKLVKYLAKRSGVRVVFKKKMKDYYGLFDPNTQNIYISTEANRAILSIFFHELGHYYCYYTKRWKFYHSHGPISSIEEARRLRRTALRAELWVDRWAQKNFHSLFPHALFYQSYRDKFSQKNFKRSIENEIERGLDYEGWKKSKSRKATGNS